MKITCIVGATCAIVLTANASASIVSGYMISSVVSGKHVFTCYVKGTNQLDTVLNVFGVAAFAGPCYNEDFVGGTWNPQFTMPGAENVDSFLTIGGVPGFANTTTADPNWGALGFNQPGIPSNAGWFNSNPPNLQGRVDAGTLSTLIAQFSFDGPIPFFPTIFQIGWNQGIGTPTQFATVNVFPAPSGVLVLVGMALGRRRRA